MGCWCQHRLRTLPEEKDLSPRPQVNVLRLGPLDIQGNDLAQ